MKMIMVSMVTGNDEVGTDLTTPTLMNAEHVRCFYPRKEDRNGTRVTFEDGGGWPIAESFDWLKAAMAEVGVPMIALVMTRDAPAVIDDDGEVLNDSDEQQHPIMVQTGLIRCFYPRKDSKPGTHLTFGRNKGIAVANAFEEVTALCA
jgi:hypothetical protein